MAIVRGITVLDLIAALPPGLQGFIPANIAQFVELLAIVDHRTHTAGRFYIHHGRVQSATDAGSTCVPPLRPAAAASTGFCEKLRFSFGTLSPPLQAIARCFSKSINAKPRVDFGLSIGLSPLGQEIWARDLPRGNVPARPRFRLAGKIFRFFVEAAEA